MTVGLVIVSHSGALADGVRELAAQMAPGVNIAVAGGTDEGGIGTSFDKVTAALEAADSGDGVVVVYDLGSALLTTETALEFADPKQAARIVVVDAPLVEGAVAVAVAAESKADLAAVAAAARAAGQSWAAPEVAARTKPPDRPESPDRPEHSGTAIVADEIGIHARPASLLARELVGWPAVTVTVGRSGEPAADARNVLALIALGLRHGEKVELTGTGPGSDDAVRRLAELINAGLD